MGIKFGNKFKFGNSILFGNRFQYEPETLVLIAAMTTPPTTALKDLINKTIKDRKSAGLWAIDDTFARFDMHDSQASCLDWKRYKDLTIVNAMVHTPKTGFTGANGKYLRTNYIPVIDSVNYISTSCRSEVDIVGHNDPDVGAYGAHGCALGTYAAEHIIWTPTSSDKNLYYSVHSAYNFPTNPNIHPYIGLYIAQLKSDIDSGWTRLYINNIKKSGISGNKVWIDTPNNYEFYLGAYNNAGLGAGYYSKDVLGGYSVGAAYTAQQRADDKTILDYWKANIGGTF